jgi:translocation and assembly module TamA
MLLTASPSYAQSLQVTGANAPLERNIRAHIGMPASACNTSGQRLARLLPDIRSKLLRASRALGYYELSHEVSFSTDGSCWRLDIAVEPGEPVLINQVNINVQSQSDLFRQTNSSSRLAPGDQLNHAMYEQIKTNLSSRSIELGFFSARFLSSELVLDLENNLADINISFDPGTHYRFGEIAISPIEELSGTFIRRLVDLPEDGFYSSGALIELRNQLSDSQYFSEITVTPDIEALASDEVPIQVALQMLPQRVYSAGIGITTDIGPRLRGDYANRYLNKSGHKITANAGISPLEQQVDLSYVIPMRRPAIDKLRLSAGVLRENNDTFDSITSRLGVRYETINRWAWRHSWFSNLQNDRYTINDQDESSNLLILGSNLTRTVADDALFPQKGWRLFGQIQGASESLLSTETFGQLNISAKAVQGFGPGRFIARATLGATWTNNLAGLPVSVQYFAGGDQSIRGYQYQSLGPLNQDGEVTGGKHLLTGSIEYDFNILPNWKLAIFADSGNAFSDFADVQFKTSAGMGIRWMSPIGPVRVDVASALDDDNKLRLHITMGPEF